MKRMVPALLAALLLAQTGCGRLDFDSYPAAASSGPVSAQVTLVIPAGCDEAAAEGMRQLAVKAGELADVRLDISESDTPLKDFQEGRAYCALLSFEDICGLRPELRYIGYPFVFTSRELLSAYLNDPDGAVRGNSGLKAALSAEVAAVFCCGSAGLFLSEPMTYGEDGTSPLLMTPENSFGAFEPGSALYGQFGGETGVSDSSDMLFYLNDGAYDCAEIWLSDMEDAGGMEGYFYVTAHRYGTYWLVLRGEDSADRGVTDVIREAAAYAMPLITEAVTLREDALLDRLKDGGLTVIKGDFIELFYSVSDIYSDKYSLLGISDAAFKDMSTVLS